MVANWVAISLGGDIIGLRCHWAAMKLGCDVIWVAMSLVCEKKTVAMLLGCNITGGRGDWVTMTLGRDTSRLRHHLVALSLVAISVGCDIIGWRGVATALFKPRTHHWSGGKFNTHFENQCAFLVGDFWRLPRRPLWEVPNRLKQLGSGAAPSEAAQGG